MRAKELLSRRRCPWEITSPDSMTTPRVKIYDTGPARLIEGSFEVGTTLRWHTLLYYTSALPTVATELSTTLLPHSPPYFAVFCLFSSLRYAGAQLPAASPLFFALQWRYSFSLLVDSLMLPQWYSSCCDGAVFLATPFVSFVFTI